MEKISLEKILRRGQTSAELLENNVFKEAVRAVESDLLEEWKSTKFKDSEAREKAYLAVRMLKDVVNRLNGYVSEAEYEKKKSQKRR